MDPRILIRFRTKISWIRNTAYRYHWPLRMIAETEVTNCRPRVTIVWRRPHPPPVTRDFFVAWPVYLWRPGIIVLVGKDYAVVCPNSLPDDSYLYYLLELQDYLVLSPVCLWRPGNRLYCRCLYRKSTLWFVFSASGGQVILSASTERLLCGLSCPPLEAMWIYPPITEDCLQ